MTILTSLPIRWSNFLQKSIFCASIHYAAVNENQNAFLPGFLCSTEILRWCMLLEKFPSRRWRETFSDAFGISCKDRRAANFLPTRDGKYQRWFVKAFSTLNESIKNKYRRIRLRWGVYHIFPPESMFAIGYFDDKNLTFHFNVFNDLRFLQFFYHKSLSVQ